MEFGIRCIRLAEALPQKSATADVLARQLIRSGTSVGANYRAAARARSRSEFIAKLGIVEEECDETIYWFEVIAALQFIKKSQLAAIQQEANELLSIFISSIKTARSNAKLSSKK